MLGKYPYRIIVRQLREFGNHTVPILTKQMVIVYNQCNS